MEDYTRVPQTTDAKAYIANLVSESKIPRLALLETILSQPGSIYGVHVFDIKELFELLYPQSEVIDKALGL